jgi:hypothetical protein
MATHTLPASENAVTEAEGLLSKAALQLRQFMCGLHGHDSLLHFEQGRISLLCASCGHETPGWAIEESPQKSASPPRIVSMPMAGERRVA